MLRVLKKIVKKILAGQSIEEAHWSEKTIRMARVTYPLRKYLSNLKVTTFE